MHYVVLFYYHQVCIYEHPPRHGEQHHTVLADCCSAGPHVGDSETPVARSRADVRLRDHSRHHGPYPSPKTHPSRTRTSLERTASFAHRRAPRTLLPLPPAVSASPRTPQLARDGGGHSGREGEWKSPSSFCGARSLDARGKKDRRVRRRRPGSKGIRKGK
jgi:hypothetical protein